MDVSEVKEYMKELEKADEDRLLEILQDLQERCKPTEQFLRETKLGVAVNKLRNHSSQEVADLVKKLVSSWREIVQAQKEKEKAKKAKAHAGANASTADAANTTDPSNTADSSASTSQSKPKEAKPTEKRDVKTDNVDVDVYSDPVRNSCIKATYNALATESTHPAAAILDAAKDVEAAVFKAERGTTPGYRNKMRSLFVNLKDIKNPTLRDHVVTRKISGEKLRTMKPQEMANDELKKQVEEIEKQNLFNAQSATEQRSVTDRFTCGKCKNKRVSYYQMQTRSADEPLTTFCTCEECGNRWKFS